MRKKVLIVNNLLGYYGAENVLVNMVNNMDQSRYDITVLTLKQCDPFQLSSGVSYKYVFSNGKTVVNRIANKLKYLLGYKWLSAIYCRNYDVSIAFKMGEGAKLVGYSNAGKKFCWIHSNVSEITEPYSYSYTSIEDESEQLQKFDSMVAVSKSCEASFRKKYKSVDRVRVIYNPIDAGMILQMAEEPLSKAEIEEFNAAIPIIGTIARIDEQKRIDRLIHISKRLSQEQIPHKLVIIGDGVDYNKFADMIQTEKLDNIKMLGFQANPYKYLKNFSAFICSSRWESYSIVVNEALVLGIPVISTKCGGPEEVLEYGKYGVLTENNEDALFEAVRKFLVDGQLHAEAYDSKMSKGRFIESVENLIGS